MLEAFHHHPNRASTKSSFATKSRNASLSTAEIETEKKTKNTRSKPESEARISKKDAGISATVYRRTTRSTTKALALEMPFMDFRERLGEALKPNANTGLSYHDVFVTPDDIKCLKTEWLTDNNIAFWEEYLERETLPMYPRARVILLRPTMAFLLMKDPNIASARSALPSFDKVTHVFLPINDSRNVMVGESGSHWSLLLVSVNDRVAFHYDSLMRSNLHEAHLATERFSDLLGLEGRDRLRFVHLDDSPQQENGRDCGVFVCLIMRHLLVKRLLNASEHEKVSMSMGGKVVDAFNGRREMLQIIETLRKEAERRRSSSPFSRKTPPRIE